MNQLGSMIAPTALDKGLFERGVVLGLSTPACGWLPTPKAEPDRGDARVRGVLRRAWTAVAGRA